MRQCILLLLVSTVALAGCIRNVSCLPSKIQPLFVGFKNSDLDTIIIREYEQGSNFASVLDSDIIVPDGNYLNFLSSNDTIFVDLTPISGGKEYLFADHDWQLYIPAQNITVSFSNFDSPQGHQRCVLGGDLCPSCYNPINSFEQNGLRKVPITDSIKNEFYGNLAVIHR